MKTRLLALLLALTMAFSLPILAAPVEDSQESPLDLNVKAAFLAETTTGQILYEANADDRLYPASTTKLMTALVAWENGGHEDMVPVSRAAVEGLSEQGSSVFLMAGEEMGFMDMMRYLLIGSGNDAANALAEHVGGSVENFAEMMNQKAQELGCENTHFVNPTGLHDENHYTSARDLYKIARAAMEIPELREIVGTASVQLAPTNMHPQQTTITTTNHLISRFRNANYYYKGAFGIKTGTTTPAGYCLVGGATDGDLEYISVVLGGVQDDNGDITCYTATRTLFDYAKDHYSYEAIVTENTPVQEMPVRFAAGKERTVLVASDDFMRLIADGTDLEDIRFEVSAGSTVDAPISKGNKLGTAEVFLGDTSYGTIDLVASENIQRSDVLYFIHQVQEFLTGPVFKIILAALLALVVLLILLASWRRRNRRRRRARRRYPQNNRRK